MIEGKEGSLCLAVRKVTVTCRAVLCPKGLRVEILWAVPGEDRNRTFMSFPGVSRSPLIGQQRRDRVPYSVQLVLGRQWCCLSGFAAFPGLELKHIEAHMLCLGRKGQGIQVASDNARGGKVTLGYGPTYNCPLLSIQGFSSW